MNMEKVIRSAHLGETKTFSIRVQVTILDAFKKACEENGSNASRTLEALMEEYVVETERKNQNDCD